jgi:hypothetical protein
VSPGARHSIGWRRRITAAFTERLALKASAMLVAVVLWLVVAAREPMEEVASVRFAPQLDSALVLRDPPPMIRALVIGRANEILKLSNTPLVIRRSIASDAPDTLVLALRTSDVEVPEGVEVIVRDVQPRALTLRFESTVSRLVPVRSAIIVRPAGTPNVSVRLDPESVTVRGPRRTIARLRSIPTVRDSITVDTLPHLIDLDTTGLGVSVRPPQVKALVRRARR